MLINDRLVLMSTSWKRAEVEHALELTRPSHAVGDNAILADAMPMLHLDEPVTPGLRDGLRLKRPR